MKNFDLWLLQFLCEMIALDLRYNYTPEFNTIDECLEFIEKNKHSSVSIFTI